MVNMNTLFLLIITLIWLVGTCLRIYRQARFYQIEEYMSARYLRWLFARPLPSRQVRHLVAVGGQRLGAVAHPALGAPDGPGEEAVVDDADAHAAATLNGVRPCLCWGQTLLRFGRRVEVDAARPASL